jgi:hypothetical protein
MTRRLTLALNSSCRDIMEDTCGLIGVLLWIRHHITGLGMKGPNPQHFYLGKASDLSLAQCIKEAYGEVEKGKRGYKVASI